MRWLPRSFMYALINKYEMCRHDWYMGILFQEKGDKRLTNYRFPRKKIVATFFENFHLCDMVSRDTGSLKLTLVPSNDDNQKVEQRNLRSWMQRHGRNETNLSAMVAPGSQFQLLVRIGRCWDTKCAVLLNGNGALAPPLRLKVFWKSMREWQPSETTCTCQNKGHIWWCFKTVPTLFWHCIGIETQHIGNPALHTFAAISNACTDHRLKSAADSRVNWRS